MTTGRKVMLREEDDGKNSRQLWAYVDADGNVHIDGQDTGPATEPVSPNGEYEWRSTIAAKDVPRLMEVLGGAPDADVLDLLEADYAGERSYVLERRLRESDVHVELFVIG